MFRNLKNRFNQIRERYRHGNNPEWGVFHLASTDRALGRIVARGLRIGTVVDVGASNGSWSAACMRHLPDSEYLLLEAQRCHENKLVEFCKKHPNSKYILAAAGNEDGQCFFDDGDPFGGLAANESTAGCKTELPMVRLDTVMGRENLKGPYLLKLDTHGFELQIIHGSEEMLRQTELAIIEAYIFRLNDKAMLSHELCAEMDKRGFQLIDFSEPMWRSKDMALWQWDLFFVKKTNPVFQSNSYA
ncbi:MAG: FkbM family methyltransferase [Nitrospirae bacterium]|nr:FkbM family methyltransferase [Nitrospirota bacterium]